MFSGLVVGGSLLLIYNDNFNYWWLINKPAPPLYPNTLQYECSLIVYLYLSKNGTEDWDIVKAQSEHVNIIRQAWRSASEMLQVGFESAWTMEPHWTPHIIEMSPLEFRCWHETTGYYLKTRWQIPYLLCQKLDFFITTSWSISSNQNRYFNMIFSLPWPSLVHVKT